VRPASNRDTRSIRELL